jgi:hypothetical protein
VAYITHHTEGFYPYSFLDVGDHGQNSAKVTGYCFGVLAAILVIFLVSWAAIRLRVWLTGDKLKRARRDPLREGNAADSAEGSGEMKVVSV